MCERSEQEPRRLLGTRGTYSMMGGVFPSVASGLYVDLAT
jgi:hypothetical protein